MLPEPMRITRPRSRRAGNAAQYFYRVLVSDVDTDGDGVGDWEEMQLGLDPNNTHSHGLNGVDDLTAVTQGLQAANVVSIAAGAAAVTEPPVGNVSTDTGSFIVTRSGKVRGPITVNYTVGGFGDASVQRLHASFRLGDAWPRRQFSHDHHHTTCRQPQAESPESVIVTLSSNAAYTLGFPSVAAVLINDYTVANGTGLMGQFWEEGSTVLSQTVLPTFTLSRHNHDSGEHLLAA